MKGETESRLRRFLSTFGVYVSPTYPSPDVSLDEDSSASEDTDSIESDFSSQEDEQEEVTYFEYGEDGALLGTKRVEYIPQEGHLKHLATSVMFFDYRDQGCTEDKLFIPLSNAGGAGDAKPSRRVDSGAACARKSSSTVLVRATSSSDTKDIVWNFPGSALQKDESVTDLVNNNHGGMIPTKRVSHLEVKVGESALGELIHRYGSQSRSRCHKVDYYAATPFTKYIPINENENGIIPFSSFNRRDPKGWCDLQVILTKLCTRCRDAPDANDGKSAPSLPLKKSTSEPSHPTPHPTDQGQLHDEITSILSGNRATTQASRSDTMILDRNHQLEGRRRREPNQPVVNSIRFQLESNKAYCAIASKRYPVFSTAIYIGMKSLPNITLSQCHVKTELLITALKHFFYPWSTVQALWVTELSDQINTLVRSPNDAKSLFGRLRRSRDSYSAAILVNKEAGQLLRHKDLGLFFTLSEVLEIHSSKLLVLVGETPELDEFEADEIVRPGRRRTQCGASVAGDGALEYEPEHSD